MNIDELWGKYATWTEGIGEWIHKANFIEAIAEIISLPVEPPVSDDFAGIIDNEIKKYIAINPHPYCRDECCVCEKCKNIPADCKCREIKALEKLKQNSR